MHSVLRHLSCYFVLRITNMWLSAHNYRAQIRQFHRRFDEHQP